MSNCSICSALSQSNLQLYLTRCVRVGVVALAENDALDERNRNIMSAGYGKMSQAFREIFDEDTENMARTKTPGRLSYPAFQGALMAVHYNNVAWVEPVNKIIKLAVERNAPQ